MKFVYYQGTYNPLDLNKRQQTEPFQREEVKNPLQKEETYNPLLTFNEYAKNLPEYLQRQNQKQLNKEIEKGTELRDYGKYKRERGVIEKELQKEIFQKI